MSCPSRMLEAIKNNCVCEIDSKPTIADGIAVRKAGATTFEMIRENVDEIVTVSEDEIAKAILFLMEKSKVVAEGAGATPIAALLAGKINVKDKKICSVISGGNMDINLMERILNRALILEGRRFEFKINLTDKAGELHKIVKIISDSNANILNINQTMYKKGLGITQQQANFVVECFDVNHRDELRKTLEDAGYEVV